MNIIIAPASPIPSLAANSIQAIKMSEALSNLGHKVTLVTKKSKQETPAMADPFKYYGIEPNFKFVKVISFSGKLGILMHGIIVSALAYLQRADVVYTRCIFTAVIAVHLGQTVIFERHDSFDHLPAKRKKMFQALLKNRNLNALVVISQPLANHLCERFDVPQDKIIVAPSGAGVIPDSKEAPPFMKTEGRPVVGHIGHLYKGRGTDLIISLARLMPGVDFHIIGGTPEDIAYWKIQANNLNNLFFHDYINPAKVPSFMQNCDILIAPYDKDRIETAGGGGNIAQWISPMKIFNYMSSGKPIICSDLTVLHEILENNQTALLCPSGDVAAWKAAVQRLCDDPIFAEKIGQKAKEKFIANYTWEKRVEAVFKKLQ
ncbi:MAG: glycosyltransferase family 4 protein [Gammaproteobacteria bacterium]